MTYIANRLRPRVINPYYYRARHDGGFVIWRRRPNGWPAWFHRFVEAWSILTGEWSLHRAWQAGKDYGVRIEYERTVIRGGR